MEQGKNNQVFETFVVERAEYKTILTDKFKNRKKYVEKDPKMITAFIPGTIVDIFVKKGSKVKEGDDLLILEAMKMRNILKAPFDGKIKALKVKVNDMVAKEQLLLEFE
jgi:biotin carboxyl carrier protein